MNETAQSQSDTTNETEPKFSNDKCVVTGIYGLRNKINGKWYVGQSVDIYKRWKSYRILKCKSQPKLYRTLKKYGYDTFEKVVIEECDSVEWILDYREMYWIRHLNSVKNGYNVSHGGSTNTNRGLIMSTSTKSILSRKSTLQWRRQRRDPRRMQQIVKKLSSAQKLAWQSVSAKTNHETAMRKVWNTESHREKMIDSYLRKPKHTFVRQDGVTFTGTRYEFLQAFSELHDGCISSILTGHRKSHKGWRVVTEQLVPPFRSYSAN